MAKRYRKTILEEQQTLCGIGFEAACAGEFRQLIGDFVISYHLTHNKMPSFSQIVEGCISENEFAELDKMYPTFLRLHNDEITIMEYEKIAEELLD